ncbi:MAG: CBS domain-containing protein [Candidatus Tectomicrobia bacterium]|nr:CBS domain-containing protein [Candidatus Tectomicrobia bacterium]
MLVKDWMTRDPITINSSTLLVDAQKLMKDNGFRRLPVVDNGKLVGIVTLSDIREAAPSQATSLSIHELHYLLSKLKITEVMTRTLVTIDANAAVEDAGLLMNRKKIGALPVMEHDRLVGIITITDIIKVFEEALGYGTPGVRYTIAAVDVEPGAVGQITAIVKQQKRKILSLLSMRAPGTNQRSLILRLEGRDSAELREAFKAGGYTISNVHVTE